MDEVRTIAVIGAGTMGLGIAQVAAAAGYGVRLADASAEQRERALAQIRANLDAAVAKGKLTADDRDAALGRVEPAASVPAAVAGADLVIEAVPERLDLKRRVLGEAAEVAPAAVLASNTSSLSIGAISAALTDPSRLVGMHFFNPVHLMPLLELVRGPGTSEATLHAVRAVGERMGKEIIVVRDSPGFATSRLGVCLGMEAIRMLEEGVASAEDIDKAMVLGYRHPIGPLRLTDLVGLDVRAAIGEHLAEELGNEAFRPPALMRRMIAEGRLGKKVGRGFYEG
jgi:3-hydroxybutyryl-CoA dehydrogenase